VNCTFQRCSHFAKSGFWRIWAHFLLHVPQFILYQNRSEMACLTPRGYLNAKESKFSINFNFDGFLGKKLRDFTHPSFFSLLLSPWKPWFLKSFRATNASKLIFKPQNRLLKSILKPFYTFEYGFWWHYGCPRVIVDTFTTSWKHSETFGEKTIFDFFQFFFSSKWCLILASTWSKSGHEKIENANFSKIKPKIENRLRLRS